MDFSNLLFDLDDPPETTLLHRAAYTGDIETLAAAASTTSASDFTDLPFSCDGSASADYLLGDSFDLLINRRLSLLGATPLRLAVSGDRSACVRWLLEHGADVDLTDVKEQTPLFVAVKEQHIDCTRILLEFGADPNGSAKHLSTPLSQCCQTGWLPGVQLLLMYGADAEIGLLRNPSIPMLPLYTAAVNHHLDCFLALLLAGCRANPLSLSDTGDSNSDSTTGTSGTDHVSIPHALLRHNCAVEFAELLYQFGGNLWQRDRSGRRAWEVEPTAVHVTLFKRMAGTPQSLFNMCRLSVRSQVLACGHDLSAVASLPLPPFLRRSLLYTDTTSLVQFGNNRFQ